MKNKTRFYVAYPIRSSRMNPRRTRIFYTFLALIWFGASIYLFIHNPSGNILFPIFYLAVGIGIVILALYYERIIFGLYIDLGTEEIELRLNRRGNKKVKWGDISSAEIEGRSITLKTDNDGERYIDLRSFKEEDWKDFYNAFEGKARENGVPVSSKNKG